MRVSLLDEGNVAVPQLVRLKAIELAIEFFKDKNMAEPKTFKLTYEQIYNFIDNGK